MLRNKSNMERNKRNRTEQRTKYRGVRLGLLPVKFLATTNELDQRETQLKCYKDILLTRNWYKIFQNKINKMNDMKKS